MAGRLTGDQISSAMDFLSEKAENRSTPALLYRFPYLTEAQCLKLLAEFDRRQIDMPKGRPNVPQVDPIQVPKDEYEAPVQLNDDDESLSLEELFNKPKTSVNSSTSEEDDSFKCSQCGYIGKGIVQYCPHCGIEFDLG